MVVRWSALVLAVVLVGGHLAALQVVAWAGMLASRVQASGWSTAVATTFDGEHPCDMCRAVSRLSGDAGPAAAPDPGRVKPDPGLRKPVDALPAGRFDCVAAVNVDRLLHPEPAATAERDRPSPEPPPPRRG